MRRELYTKYWLYNSFAILGNELFSDLYNLELSKKESVPAYNLDYKTHSLFWWCFRYESDDRPMARLLDEYEIEQFPHLLYKWQFINEDRYASERITKEYFKMPLKNREDFLDALEGAITSNLETGTSALYNHRFLILGFQTYLSILILVDYMNYYILIASIIQALVCQNIIYEGCQKL